MCANFLNKTSVNRTGTDTEEADGDDEKNDVMAKNATNLTIEEFFECQCGLMSGGECSSWQRVCADEGFDDIEEGFIEMDEGFAEMDERFGSSNARLSRLQFVVAVVSVSASLSVGFPSFLL